MIEGPNRVMRFRKNPAGRGFVVQVQEERERFDDGTIRFAVIATATSATKKGADALWHQLKTEYNAR